MIVYVKEGPPDGWQVPVRKSGCTSFVKTLWGPGGLLGFLVSCRRAVGA